MLNYIYLYSLFESLREKVKAILDTYVILPRWINPERGDLLEKNQVFHLG